MVSASPTSSETRWGLHAPVTPATGPSPRAVPVSGVPPFGGGGLLAVARRRHSPCEGEVLHVQEPHLSKWFVMEVAFPQKLRGRWLDERKHGLKIVEKMSWRTKQKDLPIYIYTITTRSVKPAAGYLRTGYDDARQVS